MRRSLLPFYGLFLSLVLGLVSCGGGGISSPADYRKAMKRFEVSKISMIQKAKEARESSDPRLLFLAVEVQLPAMRRMHAAAHSVEVDDSTLSPIHNQLLATVDSYRSFLDTIAPKISSTPLATSKYAMRDALATFKAGIESWGSALNALGP